ncbi:MAG: 16S rRNA processing protein RimM [Magnetococcales bacterium]|nr:16S rRNA processing protein RimM [Magnetococcales bacterium]MBF0440058.1 16S rRNA processing protein RimM [Magnetococcales bacterium]
MTQFRWVPLGRIKGAFGVQGEVKVIPYQLTIARILPDEILEAESPVSPLLEKSVWRLGREAPLPQEVNVLSRRLQGKAILARLQGLENREQIQTLAGMQIWIPWEALPDPGVNRFYWIQLIGLRVLDVTEDETGSKEACPKELGVVETLFATGSNDVLVVREKSGEERLLPFIRDTIVRVDLDAGEMDIRLMFGL